MAQRIKTISSRQEVLEIISRHLAEKKTHSLVFIDGLEWGVTPGSNPEENLSRNEVENVADNLLEKIPGTRRYLFTDFEIWLEFSEGKARVCTPDRHRSKKRVQLDQPSQPDLPTWISKKVIHQIEQCTDPWKALEIFRSVTPGYHVGYLSYDLKNYREQLHSMNPDIMGLPELWIGYPRVVIQIQDESADQILNQISDQMPDLISNEISDEEPHSSSNQRSSARVLDRYSQINETEYLRIAEAAQEKIHEGDYYEINLSVLFSGHYEGEAFELYRKISSDGSQPFSAFIHTGELQICSASPERFLFKSGDQLYSSPMKGTAARDPDPERDWFQQKQLQESEKERAENLMIVDLVRNDFSRVCEPGTVKADPLFEIKSYPTVHQMISTVSGRLQNGVTPEEALAACFPMGSMTGAPKITALKDIEALESYRRGIYSGAIGFFTPEGDFDFNVVIRTAFCKDDGTYVYPAGSAITSDAIGAQEWEEILLKTQVLTRS